MSSDNLRIIDTHAHVFHRQLPFIEGRRFTPAYDAAYESFIERLDSLGIDKAVLVAVSILGNDNRYLVESLERAQGRLRGVVTIDPETDFERLASFKKAGVVGIRINLTGALPIPCFSSPAWTRVLQFCEANDWHVEVNDQCSRLHLTVEQLLKTSVRIVIDHFGMPDKKLGVKDPGFAQLLAVAESRQVWVKLSGAYRIGEMVAADAAPLLVSAFGAERLLWASDWPFTQYESTQQYATQLAHLERWLPNASVRKKVLMNTPTELFQF